MYLLRMSNNKKHKGILYIKLVMRESISSFINRNLNIVGMNITTKRANGVITLLKICLFISNFMLYN